MVLGRSEMAIVAVFWTSGLLRKFSRDEWLGKEIDLWFEYELKEKELY